MAVQSTNQVNNAKPTKPKSLLQNKIIFRDAVLLLAHSSFRILSHHIVSDSTSNRSTSAGRRGNVNRTLKILLVTLSIAKNGNNTVLVGKAVNELLKIIHRIEGASKKVKITPRKSNPPNLDVLKYIKGGKYPEAEVGKCVYAVRKRQSR